MSDPRIYQIKKKLNKLIATDLEHKIFGAAAYAKIDTGHHYKLLPTIRQYEIDVFESLHQVSLPYEYKAFLTHISGGGAGPYYGLYTLEKGVDEARVCSTEEVNGMENPLSIDFPFSNSETQKFIEYYHACIEEGDDDEIVYPEIPDELTGVIFLSEYGCGWSYFLVVKGEQAGTVWFHGEYICPLFFKDRQWGFFDWYEQWLDNSLRELGHGTVNPQPVDTSHTIVNYDGHRLNEIPESVFLNANLKKLVFSRNNLPEFPKGIIKFSELRTLDLSMTPIVEIPKEIAELTKLKKLRLNYNNHTDLPDSLELLENLKELEMYNNYKLEKIPRVVTRIKGLTFLQFSYCGKLNSIPDDIGNLTLLESLHLAESPGISSLPKTIGNLKNLKHLFLNGTSIKQLPESIGQLDQLETLWIGINTLDYDDTVDKIKDLKKLHSITISNRLEYPQSFQKLESVKKVSVIQNWALHHEGNQRFPLAENITLISNLEELNLSGNNQVNALPSSMGNLSNLVRLDINSTAIKIFPESMKNLKKVKRISGGLNKDNSLWGVPPKEKEKVVQWFPDAKIYIW